MHLLEADLFSERYLEPSVSCTIFCTDDDTLQGSRVKSTGPHAALSASTALSGFFPSLEEHLMEHFVEMRAL